MDDGEEKKAVEARCRALSELNNRHIDGATRVVLFRTICNRIDEGLWDGNDYRLATKDVVNELIQSSHHLTRIVNEGKRKYADQHNKQKAEMAKKRRHILKECMRRLDIPKTLYELVDQSLYGFERYHTCNSADDVENHIHCELLSKKSRISRAMHDNDANSLKSFALGLHPRLGEDSPVNYIDSLMMRDIAFYLLDS